ncbi:MAG: energy coupling factor transporter S component ThiW [Desulfobacterales bacterium]|nr:energy coupling factor transporter S component ThiW [Desulfobacterales bacterium]
MSNDVTTSKGMRSQTRKTAYAVVLVAIGVALAPYTSFPIGIAKVNPTQHFVNVLGAVILGPWWAVVIAAVIGAIRNMMGVGTLLAFPGGMIGAFLAGYAYLLTRKIYVGALGEIIGTGLIAPVVSAVFVAPILMEKTIPMLALIPSFLASSFVGAILGIMGIKLLQQADII